jgi:hypothetical protein
MSASMAGQIAQLRTFSRQQLLDMWRKLYERAAPPGIRRELLVPFLAYRMQEHAYGGILEELPVHGYTLLKDLAHCARSVRTLNCCFDKFGGNGRECRPGAAHIRPKSARVHCCQCPRCDSRCLPVVNFNVAHGGLWVRMADLLSDKR